MLLVVFVCVLLRRRARHVAMLLCYFIFFFQCIFVLRGYQGSWRLVTAGLVNRARRIHIKDADRQIFLLAEGKCRRIHDFEIPLQGIIEGKFGESLGLQGFVVDRHHKCHQHLTL